MTADRYSGISLALLRGYRTILLRRTDAEGRATWSAEVAGMPGFRATGVTRTEALNRVKELLMSQRGTQARQAWRSIQGQSESGDTAAAA
jgi:hypothetical protein